MMIKKIAVLLLFLTSVAVAKADLTEQETEALILELQKRLKEKKQIEKEKTNIEKVKKTSKSFFYLGYGIAGGGGIYVKRSTVTGGNTTSAETELNAAMGTLKFGYSNANNNRWELSLSGISTERINKIEDTLSGIDLNWYAVYDLERSNISPYWFIGLGSYVWEDTAALYGEDLSGGAFNLGFGGLYKFENAFEFEFAYKLKFIGWEEHTSGTNIYNESHALAFLFFGLNYHF